MDSESKFTEDTWNSWFEPFQAVRLLIEAGLDDREQAVNWLKGQLRGGTLRGGGWHIELVGSDPLRIETKSVIGLYKRSTWDQIAAIRWKDDFWVSGKYVPDDPLDAVLRKSGADEFQNYLDGVRFEPAPITTFCDRAKLAPPGLSINAPPARIAGGRPPKPFWDRLWADVAAQLYKGDLKPTRQADIERVMHDWLAANGENAGETAVRARARLLWDCLNTEVEN